MVVLGRLYLHNSIFHTYSYISVKGNNFLKSKSSLVQSFFLIYFKDTVIPAQMILNKCTNITCTIEGQGHLEKPLKTVLEQGTYQSWPLLSPRRWGSTGHYWPDVCIL